MFSYARMLIVAQRNFQRRQNALSPAGRSGSGTIRDEDEPLTGGQRASGFGGWQVEDQAGRRGVRVQLAIRADDVRL